MDTEEWRPIPMAPGYEASDLGRIKSVQRGQGRKVGRIMAQHPSANGDYLRVILRIDGRTKSAKVHRLVGDAFLGPLPEGLMTRHLDGNAFDNRLGNLRYGTNAENQLDSVRHGTHAPASATHCPRRHPYDAANTYFTPDGRRICRICRRESLRRSRARKKASVA